MKAPKVLSIFPALIPSTFIAHHQLGGLAAAGRIRLGQRLETNVQASDIESADLILFCRNSEPAYHHVLDQVLEFEKPYVFELDDNFWEIPLDSPVGRHHRAKPRLDELERFLTYADLVRVYRPILKERASKFNPNVALVDAAFDFSLLPTTPPDRAGKKLSIVYATSRIQDPLYKIFYPALCKVLLEKRDLVEAVFLGTAPPEFEGIPNSRTEKIIPDYFEFISRFSAAGYDIGLAPMPVGRFFESKTNNKFREYGAARVAGIYSDVSVYSSCVEPGKTGLLAREDTAAWYRALNLVIEDSQLRNSIQENAYNYVYEHHRMELIEAKWLEQIESILQRRKLETKGSDGQRRILVDVPIRAQEDRLSRIAVKLPEGHPAPKALGEVRVMTASRRILRSAPLRRKEGELALSFEPIWNSGNRVLIVSINRNLEPLFKKTALTFEYANGHELWKNH